MAVVLTPLPLPSHSYASHIQLTSHQVQHRLLTIQVCCMLLSTCGTIQTDAQPILTRTSLDTAPTTQLTSEISVRPTGAACATTMLNIPTTINQIVMTRRGRLLTCCRDASFCSRMAACVAQTPLLMLCLSNVRSKCSHFATAEKPCGGVMAVAEQQCSRKVYIWHRPCWSCLQSLLQIRFSLVSSVTHN